VTSLEPGRFVCVQTGGWLAWLIRKATKSEYNHAFLVTGPGEIIEARPEGVMRGALSGYAGMPAVANNAEPMTQAQRITAVAKAETLVGTPYNFPDLASLGLESLGWHWKWLIRLCGADRLLICSQLVCDAGLAASPPMPWLCGKSGPAEVTPADLAKLPGVVPVVLAA
jgi:uncharacterized protein YycO